MNSLFQSYRRIAELAHYDIQTPLFCLHLLKSFLSKTAEHFLQNQSTVCTAFADADMSFLERLFSDQNLFSCILPLLRFCPATCHWQWIQTLHIWRWLTSISFECKVDVHWFNKLFWPIRTGHTFHSRKWLEICTITPPTLKDWVCWQQTCVCSRYDFHTFWKLFVRILRNSPIHPYCQPISVLIWLNTDR